MSPGAAQYTAAREVAPSRWIPWDIDRQAVSTWVLSLALVLYLALDGGGYALAAARALLRHSALPAGDVAREALQIAADLCIYTNREITVEEIP